ncbi:putative F-box domain-containing protein [Tanacetum coccineum]
MADSLPQDVILFQILTRVPTKSVSRFKCVSNQWNTVLMSNRFKEMHNRNHLKDHHLKDQKLFFLSETEGTFFTIDCESPPKKAPCSRPLPPFEASPPTRIDMLTSCHGLWRDIWNKEVTYQLMPNDDIRCLCPVHLMNNGKWLMISYRYGGSRICQVDLKKKKYTKDKDGHKSKGENKSIGNCHDEYKLYYSDVKVGRPEQVRYTETFVSPNQYMMK